MEDSAGKTESKCITFRYSVIPLTQVAVVRATGSAGLPLFLVEMEIWKSQHDRQAITARFDLDKGIFIDVFDDQDVMYQLRRVELTVADILSNNF